MNTKRIKAFTPVVATAFSQGVSKLTRSKKESGFPLPQHISLRCVAEKELSWFSWTHDHRSPSISLPEKSVRYIAVTSGLMRPPDPAFVIEIVGEMEESNSIYF